MSLKPSTPPRDGPPSSRSTSPSSAKKRPKILVVDDSAICLEAVSMMLEDGDFDVLTVDSPFALSSALYEKDPDLVLVDVAMPGLQGDKLVEITVKNRRSQRACPIVLHSDRPVSELERLAAVSGAAGFIQKTANTPLFLEQIQRFLVASGALPAPTPSWVPASGKR
jgi:two-component system cell cycle response regulator DivK